MENFKLETFVQLLEYYDGRDKFIRSIQYLALFYRWFFQDHDEELSNDFRVLASYLRKTRKMMRLFESIRELHKINITWQKIRSQQFTGTNRKIAKLTLILSRICFCLFWALDNVKVLLLTGFLKGNPRRLSKPSFFVWLLGLVSSIVHNVMLLRLSYKNEADLKNTVVSNKTPKQVLQILKESSNQRFKIMLNIIRNVGDSIIATQQLGLPRKILNIDINYGVIACGGFVSSQVGLYQIYTKIQRLESESQEQSLSGLNYI